MAPTSQPPSDMQPVPLDTVLFDHIKKKDLLKSMQTTWTASTGSKYTFKLVLARNEETSRGKDVRAFALEERDTSEDGSVVAKKRAKKENASVARIQGVLLDRGHRNFFEDADTISRGLQGMACAFFDSTGKNCRIKHRKLENLGAAKGGFLFIDEVESSQPGIDLGLHLLHAVLVFLQHDFAIAVLDVAPLNDRWCRYERNVQWAKENSNLRETKDPRGATERREYLLKMNRHFARMGFTQALAADNGWFVTNKEYFGKASEVSSIPEHWLSKEDAANIEVVLTEAPPRSALDEELHDAISLAISMASSSGVSAVMIAVHMPGHAPAGGSGLQDGDITKICELVGRGASVDGAQGMHVAAANWKTPSLFHLLKALGGDVNAADSSGNRPLHVAVGTMNSTAAKVLLQLGADKTAQNKSGSRPSDSLNAHLQSMDDFAMAMGMGDHPMIAAQRAQEEEKHREMKRLLEG